MKEEYLNEFKDFLKKVKKVNDLTIYRYCNWIRDFDIENLSQDYINDYIQKKKNNSQVRGAVLNFIEMIGESKTYDMPPKATGRERVRIIRDISKKEIDMVIDYLYSKSFRKGLVFDLVYQGALRRFEVPTIQINSFAWKKWLNNIDDPCQLHIKGKGKKERTVLINSSTAIKIFDFYKEKLNINIEDEDQLTNFTNNSSFIFTKNGKPLTTNDVWNIVHKGSIESIGRDIRPHELRHCRATELERIGVPIKDIKNYLGHSSLAVTENYLHTSEAESLENIKNILNQKGSSAGF